MHYYASLVKDQIYLKSDDGKNRHLERRNVAKLRHYIGDDLEEASKIAIIILMMNLGQDFASGASEHEG